MDLPPAILVARGASYLTVQSIFINGLNVVAFGYIARALSQAEMGVMAALLLVVGVCQLIAALGLPSAATKFLAELHGSGKLKEAGSVAYSIFLVNAVLSVCVALSLFVISANISVFLLKTSEYGPLFRLLAPNIGFASMLPTLFSGIIGLQRIKEAVLINMASTALSNSLVVVLLALGQGLQGVVAAWTIANALNVLLSVGLVIQILGLPQGSLASPLPRLLKYSLPLMTADFTAFIYIWFDRILLLAYVPLSDLGVYNVSILAFTVLVSIPTAVSTALFPSYSELKGKDGVRSLEKAMYAASRYIAYVALPLAVGLGATSFPAITLFAGQAYQNAGFPLAILSLFLATTIVNFAMDGVLMILERTLLSTAIFTCSVAVSLVLAIMLIPKLGLNGAAIAHGTSLAIVSALTVVVTRRSLALNFDIGALARAWMAALGMAASVIAVELILYNRFLLPIYVTVGAITYLTMLRILRALRPYDIHLMEAFLGGRWQRLLRPLSSFLLPSRTR